MRRLAFFSSPGDPLEKGQRPCRYPRGGAYPGRCNLQDDLLSLGDAAAGDDHIRSFFRQNATAVALPMPEVPPVMTTVLFSKVFIVGLNVAKIDFFGKSRLHLTKPEMRRLIEAIDGCVDVAR